MLFRRSSQNSSSRSSIGRDLWAPSRCAHGWRKKRRALFRVTPSKCDESAFAPATPRTTRLENELDSGSMPDEVVSVQEAGGGQELRYLKPLRIVPPCLTCHGDRKAMDVELVELLEELYPEDRAVGYENGDLRGAVSVRLTLDGVGSSVGAL
jgi:hypothetical protein